MKVHHANGVANFVFEQRAHHISSRVSIPTATECKEKNDF